MILRRLYQAQLAQASYLVGCSVTGAALIIDPNRDVKQYIDLAAQESLRITAVAETHIHADFVSGARELAQRTGAKLYLSDAGPAAWKYAFAAEAGAAQLHDGDSFHVGSVRVDVMHTPGHTPEHLSLLVTDTSSANEPMGIFTGDFVFVGDVGRPDLLEKAAGVAGSTAQAAQDLFHSIQRVRDLPDYLQIWPGHGAGSACGRALGVTCRIICRHFCNVTGRSTKRLHLRRQRRMRFREVVCRRCMAIHGNSLNLEVMRARGCTSRKGSSVQRIGRQAGDGGAERRGGCDR